MVPSCFQRLQQRRKKIRYRRSSGWKKVLESVLKDRPELGLCTRYTHAYTRIHTRTHIQVHALTHAHAHARHGYRQKEVRLTLSMKGHVFNEINADSFT